MGADKPLLFCDIDGVIADFQKGYKEMFFRDAREDDPFTVQQFVMTAPNFFRVLPVIEKGRELIDLLKDDYRIVFITTPMESVETCRRDKIEWMKENFPGFDVIFSDKKHTQVIDEKSILIDDMEYNLDPWREVGGTAINARERNDRIIEIIENVLSGKDAEATKKQLSKMSVDTNPTDAQKETGNYKKGKITFKKMSIVIENPKGSLRVGKGWAGEKWSQRMKHHYGYIINDGGQDTADGDKVDCFIGPKLDSSKVFIVNQVKAAMFDEHKVMLGFDNIDEALKAYMDNYPSEWKGFGNIIQTNTRRLRKWLKTGNLNEPFNLV